MRRLAGFVAGLLTIAATAASAQTQQHIVDPSALVGTMEAARSPRSQDVAAIRDAIGRAAVQQTASRLGIDLTHVDAALETMNDHDLSAAADAARRVTRSLVGGASTVTLSTTTIIIGLLVLILIIVAVK
jgi:hypothetical protein